MCRGAREPEELAELFHTITPWASPLDYGSAEWAYIIGVAKTVQRTDPQVTVDAMDMFMDKVWGAEYNDGGELELFLLMRVVFELPEDAPIEDLRHVRYIGMSWEEARKGNRANLSWPISWTDGGPRIVSSPGFITGPPYNPSEEFEHLLRRYPFRDLSSYRRPQVSRTPSGN
jgi:hypothetical protein